MFFMLALRNLWRQKQRFLLIFIVLVAGFSIMVALMGAVTGMNRSLNAKASRYFGGDISIAGYAGNQVNGIDKQGDIIRLLRGSGVPITAICRRTNYELLDASVFFNGDLIRQRKLIGVDWDLERDSFSGLDFISGGIMDMGKGTSVLLSSGIAERTGIRTGDECMLLLTTRQGARNTINLVVGGIYRDSSFFGSTVYLDIKTLNKVWGMNEGDCTEMGVLLEPGTPQDWAAQQIHAALSKELKVSEIIHNREEQNAAIASAGAERTYAVMTLDAHLSIVNEIVNAIMLVTWFLLLLFFVIVMIGINNTYRMVVRERTREIGTLRAMGMQKPALMRLFLSEALVLALSGSLGGLLFGIIGLMAMGFLDFSNIAIANMFLEGGHLSWYLSPLWFLGTASLMVLAVLSGVWGPARRAAAVPPVRALSQEIL